MAAALPIQPVAAIYDRHRYDKEARIWLQKRAAHIWMRPGHIRLKIGKKRAPGLSYRGGEAEHSMNFWLNGQASVPERVLKAVDIVLAEDLARAAQDRHRTAAPSGRGKRAGPSIRIGS